MALIEWNDTMSVQVAAMDDEHLHLIRLLNELHAAVVAGRDRESLLKTFEGLAVYTVYHFAGEELLMREVGYPQFDHHVRQHQALLAEVQALKEKFEISGLEGVSSEVIEFLRRWLLTHICINDRLYGRFIAQKTAAGTS